MYKAETALLHDKDNSAVVKDLSQDRCGSDGLKKSRHHIHKENTTGHPKRILLVDDDPEILFATTLRFSVAGYEILTAHDGVEATAAALAGQPDAIVMDVRMPHMDGLTVVDELKQEAATCQIPIVILSASLVDKERALDAGASYFLAKPYEGHQLIEAVKAAISGSKTRSGAKCGNIATENMESERQL